MYQITIDGLSGSGKSSVARKVAQNLEIIYFDNDIATAAIAVICLRKNISPTSEDQLLDFLRDVDIKLTGYGKDAEVIINGENVTNLINNSIVANCSYKLSRQPVIEKFMRILQLKCAQSHDVVVEGVNSGTTLFPKAKYKFFLTADADVRARRKHEALLDRGVNDYKYEDILKDTEEADSQSFKGEMSKINISEDTHFIDTSDNTENDTADEICKIIKGEV